MVKEETWWPVDWTLDWGSSNQGSSLSRSTALCSWARHFTLTVPLSTQVYKWVQWNL